MVAIPKNGQEWQAMAGFLAEFANVSPSSDLLMFGWVENEELRMVVGFNGFIGKVAQIHVAMGQGFHFTPREMLRVVFDAAFNKGELEMLLGIVNSNNEKAMKYDLHLGFQELLRLHKMHTDGGDLVVMAMLKEDCKFLSEVALADTVVH